MGKIALGEIRRRYLHDEIAERLRELILAGDLEPLSRVNEPELSVRFGTSRTPLREAIKILSTEGLVELLPNRGARIASPSQTEIEHVIEVVAALEGSAAELACRKLTDDDLRAFEELDREMVAQWKRGDEPAYLQTVHRIHAAILEASGNPVLQELRRNLASRVQRARSTVRKSPEQWAMAVNDHRRITELLVSRDGKALAEHMREHIRKQKTVLMAAFHSMDS